MPQQSSPTQAHLQHALTGRPPVAPEIDEELRQLLFRPTQGDYHPAYEDPPPPGVPPPSTFQPDPAIIGSPDFLRIVGDLLRLAPSAKQNVRRIQQHPTEGVLEDLMDAGFHPSSFAQTTLRGQYDRRNQAIGIRPDLEGSGLAGTVGHELAHAAGFGHGRHLSNIQGLAQMREEAEQRARAAATRARSK